jgi:arylsulfatase A-like enzyme
MALDTEDKRAGAQAVAPGPPAAHTDAERRVRSKRLRWACAILYLALAGSFCGLEIDSFLGDTPFLRLRTLLLFLNTLLVVLVPPLAWLLASSVRSRWARGPLRVGALVLGTLWFHVAAFLAVYRSVRHMDFDFYFFWYNTADALPALWKIFAPWVLVVCASVVGFFALQPAAFAFLADGAGARRRKASLALAVICAGSVLSQVATIESVRGSTAGFLYSSFFSDRRLRNEYRRLYEAYIAGLRGSRPKADGPARPQVLGDVVFVVKQESLNGLLAGPRITPQLMRAARDGILFPRTYANSIQSLRGYESVLCGVPPSVTEALVDEYPDAVLRELPCLPRVFRRLGYRPLYFFGGSHNPRIVRFAEAIGFEKVLGDDIVRPGDVKFDWGYREDVFFRRVDEYLERRYPDDKLLVFIDTGATNHDPFEVLDPALLGRVPYPRPRTFREHLSNTTFVQDEYFGRFYDLFRAHYAERGSLLAVADHSWPAGYHPDNIYNERGAYEENFVIPMVFVPRASRRAEYAVGSVVGERFSQLDILPTLLDLVGLEEPRLLGESFAPWLLAPGRRPRMPPVKTEVSVQPYGGGFISAVRYPRKYLFDVMGRKVRAFDLAKDPDERSPEIQDLGSHMRLIREFFGRR